MVSLDPKVRPMKRDKKVPPPSPFNAALARAFGGLLLLVLVVAAIGYGTGLFGDRDKTEEEVDDDEKNNKVLLYVALGLLGGVLVLLALWTLVVPTLKRGVRRGVSGVRSGTKAVISAPGRAWRAMRGRNGSQSVSPDPTPEPQRDQPTDNPDPATSEPARPVSF